jgi:hypothetical protein
MVVHYILHYVFAQGFAIVNYIGNPKEWTTFMSILRETKVCSPPYAMFYFRSGGLFLGW